MRPHPVRRFLRFLDTQVRTPRRTALLLVGAVVPVAAYTVLELPLHHQLVLSLAFMGVGVAIVHTRCIERHRSRLVHAMDLGAGAGKVAFSAVHNKGALRSPLVRSLLDEVKLPEG